MNHTVSKDLDHLRQRMQATTTLTACAHTVCDHLVAMGCPLPSLYLVRSGRLRCFGASGYFQVRDGFPPVSGVISATVRTGQPHIVDVRSSDLYIAASDIVEHEVCVPIFLHDAPVGALNIESSSPLADDIVELATEVAGIFTQRMLELGGIPRPTGWQFVADQAARLVEIDSEHELFESTLEVALAISAADSGMVAVGNRLDGFTTVLSRGSLAGVLSSFPPGSLSAIGDWVDGPLSVYTVGAVEGEWFPGSQLLRQAGVGTVIVTALARGDEQLGYIMVTDRRGYAPATDVVEQLELLGSLASSTLSNARHLASLRDMARRDPLTGLGHNLAFGEALHRARLQDERYAVLAIDVDHFKTVNDTHGHEQGDRVLRDVAATMESVVRTHDALFRIGGDEFAAIVTVESADEAMTIADRLADAARRAGAPVSIGIAYSGAHGASDLYARADEALYIAKRAGRGCNVMAGDAERAGSDSLGRAHGLEEGGAGTSNA